MAPSDDYYLRRARAILENMALKTAPAPKWWEFWKPIWQNSDEPLRNDARNLLDEIKEFEKHEARSDR